MGMTAKQFHTLLRFLIDSLQDLKKENDMKAREEKLDKIIDNLQKALED